MQRILCLFLCCIFMTCSPAQDDFRDTALSIPTSSLTEFETLTPQVKNLIEKGLALTRKKLTAELFSQWLEAVKMFVLGRPPSC